MTLASSSCQLWHNALLLIYILVFAPWANAHAPFSGSAIARVLPGRIDLEITLNESDALALCRTCSTHETPIQPLTLRANQSALGETGLTLFEITAGGQKLLPDDSLASLNAERDMVFRVRYPRHPGPIRFRATYMPQQAEKGANSLLLVFASTNETLIGQKLLTPASPGYEVVDPGALRIPGFGGAVFVKGKSAERIEIPSWRLGFQYFALRGDRLLFVLGIWVACRSGRKMAVAVWCEVVGFSIALLMASYGWVVMPIRAVEVVLLAMFASVTLLKFRKSTFGQSNCLGIALAYGLVEGLGAGGPLRDFETRAGLSGLVSLARYDLGVQSGHVMLAMVAFPILHLLRDKPWFDIRGVRWIFGLATLVGLLRFAKG